MRAGGTIGAGLALLLLWSLGCAGCAAETGGEPAPDDPAEAVGEVREDYAAALNAGDLEQLLSCWTEDGVLTPALHAPVRGRGDLRAYYEPLLAGFQAEIDLVPEEIEVTGDWAFDRGAYTLTLLPKGVAAGPVAHGQRGSYVLLFQRQPDGAWSLARALFNAEAPRHP
jgi:uncharacterized protein (TIGR02246 family)